MRIKLCKGGRVGNNFILHNMLLNRQQTRAPTHPPLGPGACGDEYRVHYACIYVCVYVYITYMSGVLEGVQGRECRLRLQVLQVGRASGERDPSIRQVGDSFYLAYRVPKQSRYTSQARVALTESNLSLSPVPKRSFDFFVGEVGSPGIGPCVHMFAQSTY